MGDPVQKTNEVSYKVIKALCKRFTTFFVRYFHAQLTLISFRYKIDLFIRTLHFANVVLCTMVIGMIPT